VDPSSIGVNTDPMSGIVSISAASGVIKHVDWISAVHRTALTERVLHNQISVGFSEPTDCVIGAREGFWQAALCLVVPAAPTTRLLVSLCKSATVAATILSIILNNSDARPYCYSEIPRQCANLLLLCRDVTCELRLYVCPCVPTL
jgi:hypothetical protein